MVHYRQYNIIPNCLGIMRNYAYSHLGSRCSNHLSAQAFSGTSCSSLVESKPWHCRALHERVMPLYMSHRACILNSKTSSWYKISPFIQGNVYSTFAHLNTVQRTDKYNIMKLPFRTCIGMGGDDEKRLSRRHVIQQTEQQEVPNRLPDSTWIARLANENGYLSWCRNAYLATVISLTMLANGITSAAYGVVAIAAATHLGGTLSYIYYLVALRKQVLMSPAIVLLHIILATIHFMLWLGAVLLFISSIEEAKEDHE